MGEALFAALSTLATTEHALMLALGVLIGVAVGILPGLGGTAGMAMVLPFLLGVEPSVALALMIGLLSVIATGDTFTSVLMGIPGSAGSQATVVDGFPMAKRGEAPRALAAAFLASALGGIFGALVLTGVIQVARPLVLAFGSAELLMLSIFGLSMVAVLSGGGLAKGIGACGLGLLLGSVGPAPATGHFRFTLDVAYLSDGLGIALVALGLFALPEVVDLLKAGGTISEARPVGHGRVRGLLDVIRHRWIVLRSAAIGCTVGAIPGLGGAVVDWIAYGQVVQWAKDKTGFGKGDIRGVIAPESANNAKEGGALVPTLVFGIPGSGGTALLLGGLLLVGVTPGPRLLQGDIELVYVIIWSLALGNVLGAILCFSVVGPMARLTRVPYALLAPVMVAIVFFGAYQTTRHWGDLWLLAGLGVLGLLMKRCGWPRPALLIGFVLAPGVEVYLYQAVQFYGIAWLGRPIVVVLLILTVVSVALGLRHRVVTEGATQDWPPSVDAIAAAAATIAGVLAWWSVVDIPFLGRIFPQCAAVLTVLCGLLALSGALVEMRRGSKATLANLYPELRFAGWLAGILIAMTAIGFVPALALFFVAFLRSEARASWPTTVVMTTAALLALVLLGEVLVIRYPAGAIMAWAGG